MGRLGAQRVEELVGVADRAGHGEVFAVGGGEQGAGVGAESRDRGTDDGARHVVDGDRGGQRGGQGLQPGRSCRGPLRGGHGAELAEQMLLEGPHPRGRQPRGGTP